MAAVNIGLNQVLVIGDKSEGVTIGTPGGSIADSPFTVANDFPGPNNVFVYGFPLALLFPLAAEVVRTGSDAVSLAPGAAVPFTGKTFSTKDILTKEDDIAVSGEGVTIEKPGVYEISWHAYASANTRLGISVADGGRNPTLVERSCAETRHSDVGVAAVSGHLCVDITKPKSVVRLVNCGGKATNLSAQIGTAGSLIASIVIRRLVASPSPQQGRAPARAPAAPAKAAAAKAAAAKAPKPPKSAVAAAIQNTVEQAMAASAAYQRGMQDARAAQEAHAAATGAAAKSGMDLVDEIVDAVSIDLEPTKGATPTKGKTPITIMEKARGSTPQSSSVPRLDD